ncbi:MAG: tyrosine protein kinase [Tannerella sp.]|jgi:uncharacterized protein involved in exopolysaccharide biosynthesis|nr:tyrosine protein kinase [Tannerella sp.]
MENKDNISLKGLVVRGLRNWKLFAAAFVASLVAATLYLTLTPVTYKFASAVQIQTESSSGMGGFGMGEAAGLMKSFGIGGNSGTVSLEDEMSIMASNRMLRKMILELGVNVTYSKPFSFYNMYDDSPLRLTADSATMSQLDAELRFKVTVARNSINIKSEDLDVTFGSLPGTLIVGDRLFTLDFTGAPSPPKPYRINIRCLPPSWMAEAIGSNIAIEELSKSSNVLLITCSDHSKNRGKDMLNTLSRKYNEDTKSYSDVEDRKTLAFVNTRIDDVLADLNGIELEIQAFKSKHDITLIEADVAMYAEGLQGIQKAVVEAETESRMLDMLDEYVNDPANADKVIPSLLTTTQGEKAGAISDYNETLMERDRLLKNSSPTHPLYLDLKSKVEAMREGIKVMIANSHKTYNRLLADLKTKERTILSQRRAVPEMEYNYVIQKRNQEILQGIYLLLLQKQQETLISIGDNKDRARIIEPAYALKQRQNPRKLYAAVGILVMTLLLPIGVLIGKDLTASLKHEYYESYFRDMEENL